MYGITANCADAYRKVDQYTTFRIKKEKGKKKRDILSMYSAVCRPWQQVAYCGMLGTVLMRFRPLGANSWKWRKENIWLHFYDSELILFFRTQNVGDSFCCQHRVQKINLLSRTQKEVTDLKQLVLWKMVLSCMKLKVLWFNTRKLRRQ